MGDAVQSSCCGFDVGEGGEGDDGLIVLTIFPSLPLADKITDALTLDFL